MMSNIDILDVYRNDPRGRHTLVIQNLAEKVREENLQNYLEIICADQEIKDLGFPCQDGGVAIAIFKSDLNDKNIETLRGKALKRSFEGSYLHLERLCEPDGIFIPDVPSAINNEFLSLYFESKRSGGEEESVENVEIIDDVDPTTHAVVDISSSEAINSILSKETHRLRNIVVKIEPYYKIVHGYIINKRKERKPGTGPNMYDERKPSDNSGDNTNPVRTKQQFVRPLQSQPRLYDDDEDTKTTSATETSHETWMSHASVNDEQLSYNRNTRPRYDAESFSAHRETNAFKLKVIPDDYDEGIPNIEIEPRDHVVPANTRDDRGRFSMNSGDNNKFNNHKTRNVASVKPSVRREVPRQLSNESQENNRKPRGAHGRRANTSDHNGNKLPLNCQQEIKVSSVKINMLIIHKFQSKTNSDTVDVLFKEGAGKVIIRGHSDDDVTEAQLKMHECLEQLVYVSETLPRKKSEFLAREENRKCIRSRSIEQKINAAFDVDVSKSVLRSYAFSNDAAEKGIRFFKDEITVRTVHLLRGQKQLILENDWTAFVKGLDTSFTIIYLDETTKDVINIESFMEVRAKDIFEKIDQYWKQHVPKQTSKVILETAKARCFKFCFEGSLRREVERSRGTLNVEILNNNPFKIRVCVEGGDTLTSKLTKMVDQIWHEKMDFRKISDKDEDRWLIMKGLDSPLGKDFFSKFETSHHCFIQTSKDGVIKLTRPSIRTEGAEDNGHANVSGSNEAFSRQAHVTDRGQMFDNQAEWDDEEAFELAREMSMNDIKKLSTEEILLDEEEEMLIPPFTRRQHSEGETNYQRPHRARHHSNRLHRSTTPDAQRYMLPRQNQPNKSESITMVRTRVTLMTGEIVKQNADVLVNIVSPTYDLRESIVSKAFVRRAGQEIFQMFNAARLVSNGNVVKTDCCGKLRCQSVMHIVLKQGEMYCRQMIHETIEEVLQECQANGYSTVMFPPLGVGRMYKYSPATVADNMLQEIYRNLYNNKATIREVTIVIFDDPTYAVFEKAFKSFDEMSAMRNVSAPAKPFNAMLQNIGHPLLQQKGLQQLRPLSELRQPQVRGAQQIKSQAPMVQRSRHNQAIYRMNTSSAQVRGGIRNRKLHYKQNDIEPEQDINYRERQMAKEKRPPRRRFSERMPAPNLCVVVVAEGKDRCIQARNNLGRKIKEEFLYEESIDKRQKISGEAKSKIVSIIEKCNIESVKGNQKYILKGHKESVTRARMDILEVLLGEKDTVVNRRKRKENARRETKEFVKIVVEGDPEVPSYWSSYKSDVSLKSILTSIKRSVTGKNYYKHELAPIDRTFGTIVAMINATFDPSKVGQGQDAVGLGQFGYTQLRVLKIQRIENLELYDKFSSARQKMFLKLHKLGEGRFPKPERLPGCKGPIQTGQHLNSSLDKELHTEINEVLLFHGTKDENVGLICTSGLDQRLGSGRAMFGSGIYGAETSTKADQYSDDKTNRSAGQGNHKKMFLIRMVLGNSYVCTDQNPQKYRRPPCTTCYKDVCKEDKHAANKYGHMFDSVIGDNGKLFREFVVYDSSFCYPEYIITYERV